ncbi:hypothetical protein BKA70DRAFT_1260562 [Coprinopsis sp. MPI-PUGE-AT-0042]|nr:hypothetical protein BKA70DRAFT_1260562 [Coprinopsis sp. MPI-PUGE-AT-0042]
MVKPWIAQYLLDIAVNHGAELSGIKWDTTPHRAYLAKILFDGKDNSFTWADISDTEYQIPVRISKEAMKKYSLIHQYSQFSENIGCEMTLKNTKVIFCKVPVPHTGRISIESRLVLECDTFAIAGNTSKVDVKEREGVDNYSDILLWIEGLRSGGGNGNVLKIRSQIKPPAAPQRSADKQMAIAPVTTLKYDSSAVNRPRLLLSYRHKPVIGDDIFELQKETQQQALISDKLTVAPSGPASIPPTTPKSSPERLISEWSPSPDRSQKRSPSPSSSQDMDLPIPESSYVDVPLQTNAIGPNNMRHLPSRKVLPPVPPLRREGTGQILVPNSDISMSQSQSQSQGKSQPQHILQSERQLALEKASPPKRPKPLPSQEETYDGDTSSPEGGRIKQAKRLKLEHKPERQVESSPLTRKRAHPLEITPPPSSSQHDASSPGQDPIPEDGPELEEEAENLGEAQGNIIAARPPRRRLKPLSEYYAKYVDHGLLRRSEAEAIKRQIRS